MSKEEKQAAPETVEEKSTSFKKEDNGLFRKITTVSTVDIETGTVVDTKILDSDSVYRQTNGDTFDHEVTYEDLDGTECKIKFIEVNEDEWKTNK
jgi:hypothetical protein